jgi:large subunit ribosomal protein L9
MEIILLEKVNKLGEMGEVVNVRPGYARNFLLPQRKALRATEDNKAYFDSQKAVLEKANAERRDVASKDAKKLGGLTVAMVRQASEGGQLYGSVTARDIAEVVSKETGVEVRRGMVEMNQNFKNLGLFDVTITLHPEVLVDVVLNIARSMDEAAIQEKTGTALIAGDEDRKPSSQVKAEEAAAAAEEQAADEAEKAESEEAVA